MIPLKYVPRIGMLLLLGCGTEPELPPSLPRITGTVTDSLGAPVREITVHAVVWDGSDTAVVGAANDDGAGAYAIEWQPWVPQNYDSVTLSTVHGPCRPYSSAHVARTSRQLRGLLNDSVDIPIALGLEPNLPTLATGVTCAAGFHPFGPSTSAFLLQLDIETLGAAPGDSVRGQWHIVFNETRLDLEGSFAGVVAGDTLDLAFGMAPDSFIECAPGYRLRIALDEAQRLGDGFIETLNPTEVVCPLDQLDPLRFVAGDLGF